MGKEFVNQQFKQFTDMLKIEHITTKGYDSRANGAVERFNKTLVHTMKKKMAVLYEWDDQIPFAVYAYNSVPHRTTGESPMYLFQGRDPRGPLEMTGEDAVGMSYADVDEYKNLMSQELLKAHKIAKEHADHECETYKRLFDAKHHTSDKTYPVPGSRVLVEIPAEKLGARCPKLINKWKGPYRVVSCSNNSAKIVPAWRRSTETLLIPFDKLRLIPSQMGNDPIVTNKGRRAWVKGNEGGEFSLDGLSEQVTYNNDLIFRDLYTCKCPTPCRFFIPDTPKFKPGCFTTSPTQFNRMHVILGLNPDMRSDPDALQLLAMSPLPLKEKPPTDAVWRAMSHCATLKLVAEDVPGWGISYQNLYGRLVNSCLSAKLMQKETVVIQLCPGVKSSQVPLSNTMIRKWDDDKEGEDTSMDSCSLALIVVPFRTDEHEVEEWQAEVDQWPSDVKNLVMVTAPGAIKDFAKVPVVAQQMKEVKRKSGNLIRITPDELVPSQQNKSLALVGDTRSYETYWKTVKAMLETLGIPWTSFELEREKRAADMEKDRKSESSTSDKGGQGPHHSVAKKRRFH
ncbi:hypothetical protein CAEBREN_14054 [Caenorhabditis brenneri]|uniref:Uncharacterized protein n=1 Tax=Caenorhabditis brenneri TaxID=135651 RepID=G0PDP1_CAEBE|nr:hypothetical protein CAEBREN_14054 [Caenorhabditis brenneri]